MSRSDQRQSPTIARFLLLARRHFGLDLALAPAPQYRPAHPARPAAHRGLLRTLLIAGSIGSMLGTTAYAGGGETAPTKSRPERSASSRTGESQSAGPAAPKALERMP